ncbi:hypothetical protein K777_09860, partial [Campylobacter coli CVM 41970]
FNFFFFQAEDGIRDAQESRGLGDVYKRQTIDRAVFDSTIIKAGTKVDNLVQIGHNCDIGQNCIIVAQTGISGSSELGRNVVMGGQSATSGHLRIGDFSTIA